MKNKISFLICTNDEQYLNECIYYINRLTVPDNYEVEIHTKIGAASMCSGYNELMRLSDAKIKIYMHQDTFIIDRSFLLYLTEIFESDESIGLVGMVGYEKATDLAVMWKSSTRIGAVPMYGACGRYKDRDFETEKETVIHYKDAVLTDGFLMATSKDLPWDEENFDGWDFYDADQSFNFLNNGFRVVVPIQDKPWCVHDDGGYLSLWKYNTYRRKFLDKYAHSTIMSEAEKVDTLRKEEVMKTLTAFEDYKAENDKITDEMYSLFDEGIKKEAAEPLLKIPALMKNEHFVMAGRSGKLMRMINAFGKLNGPKTGREFEERYNELVFALRRIELCGDYTLFKKIIPWVSDPTVITGILNNEYFERKEYICNSIAVEEGLFVDDEKRIRCLMAMGEEYPSETILSETASLWMDYNEYEQALFWLEKIGNPSKEMGMLISELKSALGK